MFQMILIESAVMLQTCEAVVSYTMLKVLRPMNDIYPFFSQDRKVNALFRTWVPARGPPYMHELQAPAVQPQDHAITVAKHDRRTKSSWRRKRKMAVGARQQCAASGAQPAEENTWRIVPKKKKRDCKPRSGAATEWQQPSVETVEAAPDSTDHVGDGKEAPPRTAMVSGNVLGLGA